MPNAVFGGFALQTAVADLQPDASVQDDSAAGVVRVMVFLGCLGAVPWMKPAPTEALQVTSFASRRQHIGIDSASFSGGTTL